MLKNVINGVIHSHPAGWWGPGMTVDNPQEALIIPVRTYFWLPDRRAAILFFSVDQ